MLVSTDKHSFQNTSINRSKEKAEDQAKRSKDVLMD